MSFDSSFPRARDAYLAQRVAELPQGATSRKWTLRDDNRQEFHGTVRSSESPLFLRLLWRATARDAVREIGLYRFDLDALLADGYIRREPSQGTRGLLRVRFFRSDDGLIYIQTRADRPALPIGEVGGDPGRGSRV